DYQWQHLASLLRINREDIRLLERKRERLFSYSVIVAVIFILLLRWWLVKKSVEHFSFICWRLWEARIK
ncbi:MAG: hypothetical protein J6T67_05985, partial [Paludibacteraceae bacterium]|nr:hypothetical protein [Paludibacteraceae bacterium]